MVGEAKEVNIVAELTIAEKTEKVVITRLAMSHCIARATFNAKKFQHATIRFFERKADGEYSPFSPVKSTIDTSSQKKSDPGAYYVKIKFNDIAKASQGIVQLLHSQDNDDSENEQKVKAKKNSLRVTPVGCHMCGQNNIPYWFLLSRSMLTKSNIFEVPCYTEAIVRKDFCDYNRIRVIVCPSCYFASNDVDDFQTKLKKGGVSEPLFDKTLLDKQWKEGVDERKQLVSTLLEGFYGEERDIEQALLAYDLGIFTNDAIFASSKDIDPRRRDYGYARKSVSCLMFKADLLMNINRPADAAKLLESAATRLEEIFQYLNNEPSIRAAFLLGMLSLYFEQYRKVGQYLTFLREFNQDGNIVKGSSEHKALTTNIKKLDDAFQARDEYSKSKLTGFQKPF